MRSTYGPTDSGHHQEGEAREKEDEHDDSPEPKEATTHSYHTGKVPPIQVKSRYTSHDRHSVQGMCAVTKRHARFSSPKKKCRHALAPIMDM